VGTVLEVTEHSMLEDGRLLVQSVGRERFQIREVVQEKPLLICDVAQLPEDDDTSEEAAALAVDIATSFRQVLRLSAKLRDAPVPAGVADPVQLQDLGPRELSFWVASLFAGNPYNQQALLEEENTLKRLATEQELLSSTLKYLSAQTALQSAFAAGGAEGESAPPLGGPD
jgi:ATP-dependent Lon protease